MNEESRKNLRFNYIVNMFDGGFFGLALGFASFTAILPLFVYSLTDSALLIGLIPAIHNMGWQLPQLFTARYITRLEQFKPFVTFMTIQERLPFLGFALVAWFLPSLGTRTALIIIFILLIWQGLGAGMTANAWQNMVAKIIPSEYLATFFGMQSGVSNLLSSAGSIIAGILLTRLGSPLDFTLCFLLACVFMAVSWLFLRQTREPKRRLDTLDTGRQDFWKNIRRILVNDHSFRWFLITRLVFQFGLMAFAFYTVYAVHHHGLSEAGAGLLASVLLITQVAANPLLGWLADHWSRKYVLEIGAAATACSALLAWLAPSPAWFYLVMVLEGIANTSFWTIGLAATMDFGSEQDRPSYVGLANTMIAPTAILAPVIGGWLADEAGYAATFILAASVALLSVFLLHFFVRETRPAV